MTVQLVTHEVTEVAVQVAPRPRLSSEIIEVALNTAARPRFTSMVVEVARGIEQEAIAGQNNQRLLFIIT